MKGVILAGGTGSRLFPLTKVTNKHLLPIGKYPMIYHAIYKLREAGIESLLIVTGREHMGDVVSLLGSGQEFGVTLTYKVQDEPGGIAQALGLAEDFANGEQMTVILADNVFSDTLLPYVDHFRKQGTGAKILLAKVADPSRFGVPQLHGDKITLIEEKPCTPKSDYAVTGIYMYDSSVFDIIKTLTPSGRGELEITDVNNAYIQRRQLTYDVMTGWWTDAGTHASFFRANELAKDLDFGDFGRTKNAGKDESA
ncbi:NTP transferase domain-containing protein [Brevibacillus humidisoli]|uniref:sugar phosphate nucleotidyltransferase n=1 Tax=Brevibacillus humidisoli TaxID=2895522 RepID=UPI001E34290A|nr:sugar phosphate nucleotidyltransferase [Brevibacillus humidisoli]UFJ42534.1 NTP transferase domain-containing protein [Brevibacillus humidisoli]